MTVTFSLESAVTRCSGGIVAAGVGFAGAEVVGALSRGGAVGITATGEAVVGVGGVSPGTAAKAFAGADETGVGGLEAFFRRQPVAVITAKIDNKKKALIQFYCCRDCPRTLPLRLSSRLVSPTLAMEIFRLLPLLSFIPVHLRFA